jgi:hypothetical protein
MLVERRLAVASRNLLRGGARRKFSVQAADLDASKRGVPIPSMPTGEEFLKARAAIKEHAVREHLYIYFPNIHSGKLILHRALQTLRPSGAEFRELAIPENIRAGSECLLVFIYSLFVCVPISGFQLFRRPSIDHRDCCSRPWCLLGSGPGEEAQRTYRTPPTGVHPLSLSQQACQG